MKKLLSVLIVLSVLFVSSVSLSEDVNPVVGAWYVLFDYKDYPPAAESAGKSYTLYMLIFEKSGVISGLSAEKSDSGIVSNASVVGTWSDNDGTYTANILGNGSFPLEFSEGHLLIKMIDNVWYSMHRMDWCDWYTDIILRYN